MSRFTIGFMITDGSVSAVIDGQSYVVSRSNPTANQIIDALKKNKPVSEVKRLFDLATAIRTYTTGKVTIRGNDIMYNGEIVQNSVTRKILAFMSQSLPVEPLLRFLENLMANPSKRSVDQLYKFLEAEYLPITPDGHFLGYKAVRSNWLDKHTGTISNHIGAKISCDRNKVDDNPGADCSVGYHVGNKTYVDGFASSGDHIVICKVNPRDVVSVPHSDCGKLRCCAYEVVAESTGAMDDTYDSRFGDLPEPVNSCEALSYIDAPWKKAKRTRARKPSGQAYHNRRDSSGRFA